MAGEMKTCGGCNGRGQIWVQIVSPKEKPGEWVTCTRCGGSGQVRA
jgi:DnaJ-class molecular chaperone